MEVAEKKAKAKILVVDDEPRICEAVERALERTGYQVETSQSASDALERLHKAPFDMVICDIRMPAMERLLGFVAKVARTDSSVLITGESGSGKEVVARLIHFGGARAEAPFVTVNCSAIPNDLLESELFGHMRGAFTGAYYAKRGSFEQAGGGTLFLDEIGDMRLEMQAKILRVLEERRIRRVGSEDELPIDVRIIAATNKDLAEEIKAGRFREGLFYRLATAPNAIPP